MKFEALDARMRVFETTDDRCVPADVYMVVRLDGRSFTRHTKEVWNFEAPFDVRFRDLMLQTTEHLMCSGFNVVFAYTESDEISLLMHPDEASFGRKARKFISILAGEASAKFSLALGSMACFDARICPLPNKQTVIDYFRWRHEDAHRNALHAHCYWALRKAGISPSAAADRVKGLSIAAKTALLSELSIDFSTLPPWQKRGCALFWETHQQPSLNRKTGEQVLASRRRIKHVLELLEGDDYAAFVASFLETTPVYDVA